MLYCLKRINDPCYEHIGNNFSPVAAEQAYSFERYQTQLISLFLQADTLMSSSLPIDARVAKLRDQAESLQSELSDYRKQIIDIIQQKTVNIESMTVFLNLIQESQQLLSCLRHLLRGMAKFSE